MSARSQAIKQLGSEDNYINVKGYQTERQNAQSSYDTNYNKLQTDYNKLVEQSEANKLDARKNFNDGRLSVASDEYMNSRGITGADLSSRGTSEGFKTAGKLSSILSRNNANSALANTYYNSMDNIQKQMDSDTENYNYNVNNLKLNLDSTLANINAREAAARNAYRAAVAQLAEQIQARYDANANAQASLKAMKDQIDAQKNAEMFNVIKGIFDNSKLSLADKIKQASQYYKNQTGNSNGEGYLYSQGFISKNEYAPYITSPITGNATGSFSVFNPTIHSGAAQYSNTKPAPPAPVSYAEVAQYSNTKPTTNTTKNYSTKPTYTNTKPTSSVIVPSSSSVQKVESIPVDYSALSKYTNTEPIYYNTKPTYTNTKPVSYSDLLDLWR